MINSQSKIKGLQIGLASPEQIRSWSHGEITKSETINYKTLKPEKGGLFDEVIFGPMKDYECACGKYKKVKYRGKICEKCGVEIIESIVRRERMGHIELAAPVAHIWMTKELPNPSKISLVLGISYKEVEQVVYFVNYIVLDNNGNDVFANKEIINLTDKNTNRITRGKLRKVLDDIRNKVSKESLDYRRANDYYNRLKDSALPFSIEEVFNFIKKHTGIRLGIGAEAILELLKNTDLEKETKIIEKNLSKCSTTDAKFRKLMRRLETIRWFIESNNKPEWMILKVIPVTPPDTRPIIQLEGGRFTTSDINNFYRKIVIRNDRLRKIMQLNAPSIILNNEKRMLQESVDALFDNASRSKPILTKDKRPLKSLTDHLKGKQGLFRQNLLGKRVDYSGRSVIVVGPELKMYEVGIPSIMLLKLFKPFIIHELIKKVDENGMEVKPIASNIKLAEKMILKQENIIWPIVQKVIKERPVLLNRAPTLHRLGIQAFEPKMIDGKAIRLHPLVTVAFNADFDGDQMAVHVPLSKEAIGEARDILMASWHILGPKDGKPVITPTQDMILGVYYLSTERKNMVGEGTIFGSTQEVIRAYVNNQVHPHTIIGISTNNYPNKHIIPQGILITTVGKVLLNNVLPSNMVYLNDAKNVGKLNPEDVIKHGEDVRKAISEWKTRDSFNKKTLQQIVSVLYTQYPIEVVSKTMDAIKGLGFRYSTKSGVTVSAFDIPIYQKKQSYIEVADEQAAKYKAQFRRGLLTDDERYKKIVQLWNDVKNKVTSDVEQIMDDEQYKNNSIIVMAKSGARGNVSQFTQLIGMRGLMSKSYNYDQKSKSRVIKDVIEVPIKHAFIEGLTIQEYFNSSFGARKGMADTAMKTSKSGYMTRKLVDAAQEVIVTEEDCGTIRGLVVEAIYDEQDGTLIEPLTDRIANRFSMHDIFHPKSGEILVKKNEIISPAMAEKIEKLGIKQVEVRSVLYCNAEHGVCQKCFGNDLTTNKPIEIGTAIGVVAAQSIGEPGTQLTMRTFHTGGAAGGSNIAQGFERLKQLFDMVPPKEWEKAVISEIDGVVKTIEMSDEGYIIEIKNNLIDETRKYSAPLNSILNIKVNSKVHIGSKITEGSLDIMKLLQVSGIQAVRNYIIKEVQKVYRIQGIEISDKYIEIIVHQMTNKAKVLSPGDSKFFIGQIIDLKVLQKENNALLLAKKVPITAINAVFSLDNAPAKADSFLSAASFQDTKKILTDAAVRSQTDKLRTLKENVMIGGLIPVGMGLIDKQEVIERGAKMYEKEY